MLHLFIFITQTNQITGIICFSTFDHYEKYRNFTWFPGVGISRKGTVSSHFRANRPKLCGNCAFTQNSCEMMVFFTVDLILINLLHDARQCVFIALATPTLFVFKNDHPTILLKLHQAQKHNYLPKLYHS